LTNEKWHFWWQNYLEQSISDDEKMAKFEILGKIFQKVCTFWQTKIKWKPKASKLFWQNFVK